MIPFGSADYQKESSFKTESLRVYDICTGCRRCFNLCPSFTVLFDGIDDKDGDVHAVQSPVLNQVVDLCYYCKLCFNHCPYSPPHDYDLDFPRLMLWGKFLKNKEKKPSLRDRLLANIDLMGRLGGMVAPITNRLMKLRSFRWVLEKVMGLHRKRLFPSFTQTPFIRWFQKGKPLGPQADVTDKVALFYTCYVNRHDPEIGKATIQVLKHNQIETICPEQVCCGMPYYDIGDLETVRKKAEVNITSLAKAVDAGYKIIAPVPTCSLMLKKEYPDLLGTKEALKVAANTLDLCEYLMTLNSRGKLSKEFVWNPGKVAYQVPCHLRDQNIGLKSRDLLRLIPGTSVEVIEKCTGHDGTFGVKVEFYDDSIKIGKKAFSEIDDLRPDTVVSDCPLSGLAVTQATGNKSFHPIEILKKAYGIKH